MKRKKKDVIEERIRKVIESLENSEKEIHEKLHKARLKLANYMCPVEVGNYVKGGKLGYLKETDVFIVDKIWVGRWEGEDYRLCGRKMKKDGALGKVSKSLWGIDVPVKVDKPRIGPKKNIHCHG